MRILVADDHALIRDGIASLLEAWGHAVVGQAADGTQAVAMVDELRPDLVLMDVRMPTMSGIEATRRIVVRHPDIPIVMLTVSEDEDDLFEAIRSGARGYLLKSLEAKELRSMLDVVARGEAAIAPTTAFRIIRLFAERTGRQAATRGWHGPHGPGARGPGARHRRAPESGDRDTARDQRAHGEVPPPEHPREAPCREPD